MNSAKENNFVRNNYAVKNKFYFQFSFATNEQVQMILKKCKYFSQVLLL